MEILTQLCNWWWLAWLLPFFLGLLFGWSLWARYKKMKEDLEHDVSGLKAIIKENEVDLERCKSHNSDLNGQIVILKGRLRETQAEKERLEDEAKVVVASIAAGKSPVKKKTKAKSTASDATQKKAGASSSKSSKPSIYSILKPGNLQVIEGIGPKMEEILKKNNIRTWKGLSTKSTAQLKAILKKEGGTYVMTNPEDWPRQAILASGGNWSRLVKLQKELDGGRGIESETDAKVEKMLIKMGALKK